MPEYRTISSKQIYAGHIINLRIDKVQLPSEQQTEREVVEHHGAVAIVALDSDGHILLVKQFRQAAGKELLEIPAGCIDLGETPEKTARRELQEETGFSSGKLAYLCGFYSAPSFTNEYLHIFLATELFPSQLIANDTAEINVIRMPLFELMGLINGGGIEDSKSIAALLYYYNFQACLILNVPKAE